MQTCWIWLKFRFSRGWAGLISSFLSKSKAEIWWVSIRNERGGSSLGFLLKRARQKKWFVSSLSCQPLLWTNLLKKMEKYGQNLIDKSLKSPSSCLSWRTASGIYIIIVIMLYPHFDKSITSLIMSGGDLKRDSLIAKVTTLAQSNSQTGDLINHITITNINTTFTITLTAQLHHHWFCKYYVALSSFFRSAYQNQFQGCIVYSLRPKLYSSAKCIHHLTVHYQQMWSIKHKIRSINPQWELNQLSLTYMIAPVKK